MQCRQLDIHHSLISCAWTEIPQQIKHYSGWFHIDILHNHNYGINIRLSTSYCWCTNIHHNDSTHQSNVSTSGPRCRRLDKFLSCGPGQFHPATDTHQPTHGTHFIHTTKYLPTFIGILFILFKYLLKQSHTHAKIPNKPIPCWNDRDLKRYIHDISALHHLQNS